MTVSDHGRFILVGAAVTIMDRPTSCLIPMARLVGAFPEGGF